MSPAENPCLERLDAPIETEIDAVATPVVGEVPHVLTTAVSFVLGCAP
jgi:hypothetical protein